MPLQIIFVRTLITLVITAVLSAGGLWFVKDSQIEKIKDACILGLIISGIGIIICLYALVWV